MSRRGAAIDLIFARFRENRSQLVFTTARGRDAVFWQSPRTRKQARPQSTPTARAAGIRGAEIVVDAHERYAYRFAGQQVRTTSRALPCGDYGIIVDGQLVAGVERKSLPDLIASLTSGSSATPSASWLPCPAPPWSSRTATRRSTNWTASAPRCGRRARRMQIRWPNSPIVFCETRKLAEEWTYRYLAAAHDWAPTEHAALQRSQRSRSTTPSSTGHPPLRTEHRRGPCMGPHAWPASTRPRAAETEIWQAWHNAHRIT